MTLRRSIATLLSGVLLLSACEEIAPPVAPPAAAPEPPPEPAPRPAPPRPKPSGPSAESVALTEYYRRLQADLLSQGLLRGDGGGADAPFTDAMLARNFLRVALFDEYTEDGSRLVAEAQESRLRRWDDPIRMEIVLGESLSAEQGVRDRAAIQAYAARLSRLTGVEIAQVDSSAEANFHVAVLSEDDREGFEGRLREMVPGIAESSVRAFLNLPRTTLCLVIAFGSDEGAGYSQAVALIRAEHPPLLRSACIHEELAQGMGLANDSPQARPSIFNDDEEFGLLTRHDELLLKMLYDPRLRTGMTLEEAEPVVRVIARELMRPPA